MGNNQVRHYVNYEVYRKRGKGWQYLGIYGHYTMRAACLDAGYVNSCKILKARPEGSRDKFYIFRFDYVPLLTSSSGV